MLGNVKTSKQAWDVLHKSFASKTRARILFLKERLSRSTKGSKNIAEYLQQIKSIADELAIINVAVDDDDLVIHTLNGLGPEYKEVSAALRTREHAISFDELHDMLSDFESYLQRNEASSDNSSVITTNAAYKGKTYSKSRSPHTSSDSQTFGRSTSPTNNKRAVCQYCHKLGHTAKVCYKIHGYPPEKCLQAFCSSCEFHTNGS